ncbi:nuclear transport factor 2 family protein [Streptomyces lasalocidi]
MDADSRTRASVEEHWRASERGDTEAEYAIYATDAILDYPQSGERFRGRAAISAQRGGHPADRHFTVQRITGHANLWVSECLITYDGVPSYSVSIMEFADQHVVHETQYFADPFGVAGLAGRARGADAGPDHCRSLILGLARAGRVTSL